MTFTLVNECYEPKIASQKIAYLLLAFAIMPSLSIALGGIVNSHFGWLSCFYATALYGLLLLVLCQRLPDTLSHKDSKALHFRHLFQAYSQAFTHPPVLLGGCLTGLSTACIYVFAAITPFIAMQVFGMSSQEYGLANVIPSVGLVAGSLISAHLAKSLTLKRLLLIGLSITAVGIMGLAIAIRLPTSTIFVIFLPIILVNAGLCFILANASTIALSQFQDKAHASAAMNFLNMGCVVWLVGFLPLTRGLLPMFYGALLLLMMLAYGRLVKVAK